ncbi:MAG: hypothetical protein JWQ04_616 [Pedosphaera sp.]|nr:hypothetical protein [Pedosphaera sp.]
MKNLITKYPNRTNAFTLIELLVVIVIFAIGVGLLFPALKKQKSYSTRIRCVSNLKQVGLAFRIWAGDNGERFPMQVYTNQSGAQQFANDKNAFRYFQVMSNDLSNPEVLFCSVDKQRTPATNFTSDFNGSRISYFIGLDATLKQPQAFLAGDSDITGEKLSDVGIMEITDSRSADWSKHRHTEGGQEGGNVLLADGSVQQFSTSALRKALQHTGLATNRLLLPNSAGK